MLIKQNFVLLTTTHYPTIPNQYNTSHETWLEGQCRVASFAHEGPDLKGVAGGAMASLRRSSPQPFRC